MRKEHKLKISEGMRKYHNTCKPKKPKSEVDKEIGRLMKRVDKNIKKEKKKKYKK